jgi:magnesium chelatase family protein
MVAKVQTGSLSRTDAIGVVVEISQTRGLPGFDIVGFGEAALRESRVRVTTAIGNCGYQLPDRKYVVRLAPADVRKSGASFDLAIAIALLGAAGVCQLDGYEETLFLAELSLDGQLRASRGAADLQLEGSLISRRHVLVRALRDGLEVEDISTHGTLVYGKPVRLGRGPSGRECQLLVGCVRAWLRRLLVVERP